MVNRLSALFELQQIDDELDSLEELRGDLPLEVDELTSEIQNIKETIDINETAKSESNKTIKSNESEIERLNTSLTKFKDQLYQVRNNKEYDALTKEIEHSEEKVKVLTAENVELENKVQSSVTELELIQPQLDELSEDVGGKEKELKTIVGANEQEEKILLKKREVIAAKIRTSDYNTYTRIRKACGGKAVSTITRSACSGCHNVVPPQRQIEIRASKRLFTCESCGRLLISPNVAAEVDAKS